MHSCALMSFLAHSKNELTYNHGHVTPLLISHDGHNTFHRPMVDGGLGDESDSVEVDPFPEDDFICHLVGLHLALHLNVEDLKVLASYRQAERTLFNASYRQAERTLFNASYRQAERTLFNASYRQAERTLLNDSYRDRQREHY